MNRKVLSGILVAAVLAACSAFGGDVYRDAVTYNVAGDAEGCAEDIRVAEAFKELLADRAVKFRDGTAQSMQIDYKGLQR